MESHACCSLHSAFHWLKNSREFSFRAFVLSLSPVLLPTQFLTRYENSKIRFSDLCSIHLYITSLLMDL